MSPLKSGMDSADAIAGKPCTNIKYTLSGKPGPDSDGRPLP